MLTKLKIMDSDIVDMVNEVKEKVILHWNYRGLTEIPEAVRNVGSHVHEIYLKFNDLERLPNWMSDFSSVTNLYLHGNCLENLPVSVGYMKNLTVLDISNNKLEELPPSFGFLENLQSLLINNNSIKSLPSSMNNLKNVEHLYLSSNQLMALPEWLGSLPKLKELFVDNNFLEEIPNRLTLSKSLSLISVCSNSLSYLPPNGFVSSPCIRFDSNPHLNYLSLTIFHHLLSKVQSPHSQDSMSAIVHGCFRYRHKNKFNVGIKLIIVREGNHRESEEIIIELPRQLLTIYSLHENQVISLWESSLRKLYRCRFNHTLDICTNPPNVDVKYNTLSDTNHSVDGFSQSLIAHNLLINGPISICMNTFCNEPIFTEAWVLIGIRKITFVIPIIVLLCSQRCAADFVKSTSFLEDHEMHGMHKFNRLN